MGKTTVAAATALGAAATGVRTLVLSTDPAHSLGDAFDVELDSRPREIAPRLWGQQLDAQERMEESWDDIRGYLVEVFDWAGVNAIEAEELAVFPGLDEIFALSDIRRFARSDAWDLILVDCAPTAETIRFLSLPDILSWYMDRIFPVSRKVNRVVGPVLSKVTSLPVASDNVFAATRRFYEQLDGVKELLADNRRSTVRLVVNPERMVIAEARRTYTYLSLFGYRVDAVIANRLLPDAIGDPWFDRWKELHAEHLRVIEEAFAPVPVLRAELASDELVGIDALAAFAERLFGDLDPAAVLHEDEPMMLDRERDGFVLTLHLPFADHDDLELGRHGDELLVRVGPYRRAVLLPDSIRRRPVASAALRAGRLRVTFADADEAMRRSVRG